MGVPERPNGVTGPGSPGYGGMGGSLQGNPNLQRSGHAEVTDGEHTTSASSTTMQSSHTYSTSSDRSSLTQTTDTTYDYAYTSNVDYTPSSRSGTFHQNETSVETKHSHEEGATTYLGTYFNYDFSDRKSVV